MRELEQHTIFLREHIMLPEGIALAGETIREGWVVLQSGDALWLDKTIRGLGWNSNVLDRIPNCRFASSGLAAGPTRFVTDSLCQLLAAILLVCRENSR